MPELPEVELVARSLRELIVGSSVIRAELLRPRLSPKVTPEEFSALLSGRKVLEVSRRGKFILIKFDNDLALMTHLRMTGRFGYVDAERELPKFTHAIFHLKHGKRLIFSDQRHFGMMKFAAASSIGDESELAKLAPEPFSEEFSPDYLRHVLTKSRKSLKETLLDQTKVLGLGNIYAAEVLFRARIRPQIVSQAVSKVRVGRLHTSILSILQESIDHGSTLNVDPENIDGSYVGGNYEGKWSVYDREGEACYLCGRTIRRILQGGRSTYYCPGCQRA